MRRYQQSYALLIAAAFFACSNETKMAPQDERTVHGKVKGSGDVQGAQAPASQPLPAQNPDESSEDANSKKDHEPENGGDKKVEQTEPEDKTKNEAGGTNTTRTIERIRSDKAEIYDMEAVRHPPPTYVENPRNPLTLLQKTWKANYKTTSKLTVAGAGAKVAHFQKTAPIPRTDRNTDAKNVFLFGIFDTSRTFAGMDTHKAWAKADFQKLVQELYGFNLMVVVCGLEASTLGTVERYVIDKGSSTSLAVMQSQIDAKITTLFSNNAAAGNLKNFRSSNLCMSGLSGANAIPAGAVRVIAHFTDGGPCRDNDNKFAADCNQAQDRYTYLVDSALGDAKHLTVVGGAIRRTDGACEPVQKKEPAEGLYRENSQLLSAFEYSLNTLYPTGGAPATYSTLGGDICSGDHGLAAMTELAKVAKDLRNNRVRIGDSWDSFPENTSLNLALTADGTATMRFLNRASVVVSEVGGALVATSHKRNNYDKLTYTGALSPAPDPAAYDVKIVAGAKNLPCKPATSQATIPNGYTCGTNNTDFYLHDLDFLAALRPGDAAINYDVAYTSGKEHKSSLSFPVSTAIYLNSVELASMPDLGVGEAVPQIANRTLSGDGNTVTVTFVEELPAGDYTFKYVPFVKQSFPHSVALAAGAGAVVCYTVTANASASLDAVTGAIKVENATVVPCEFARNADGNGGTVSFNGEDGVAADRTLNIALKAIDSPVEYVNLSERPDTNSVTIEIRNMATKALRDNQKFTIDGIKLIPEVPLQAGESINAVYTVTPPIHSKVFVLEFRSYDDTYKVTKSVGGVETEYQANIDYSVGITTSGKQGVITFLSDNAFTNGDRVKIFYTTQNTNTENTETSPVNP